MRRALRRFNVARMGRRWGKTVFGEDYLLDLEGPQSVLRGFPVAWFAPNYKYLKEPWRDIKRILRPLIRHKDEVDHRIELTTGGVVEFWTLDSDDPARGRKYARIVVDEAAIVRRLLPKWNESIRPTLTDYRGGALFASTPKGRNDFHKLDQRSLTRPSWASFHAPTRNNPHISEDEIEEARLDMPALVFRQEYLADYVESGGAVVQEAWIQAGAPPPTLPIVLGVDLAISTKSSADWTAIVAMSRNPRDGHVYVRGVWRFRAPFNEILERIKVIAKEQNAVAIGIEDNQFQAAVVQELLRTTKLPVRGLRRDKDKLTAFMPLAVRYEQGLVFHEEHVPAYFVDELLAFTGTPDDDHDDMVDAASNAFLMLPSGPSIASAGASTAMAMP